jgi:hypothetical protein
MTTPAVAAARFGMAAAVGAGLGLFYGFLRPLRRKSNWLADLIFVIAAFFGWLYVGFGICRGDLRMAYFAGMALGGFGWEMTVGKLLRPVFFGFWQGIRKILAVIAFPMKKIFEITRKIAKKVFAKCRKWVTMEKNICRHRRRRTGGRQHGRTKKKTLSPGVYSYQAGGQTADPAGGGIVHRGAGGAAGKYRRRKKPV